MPGLSIGGLASGLDTKAIVAQLTALEARGLGRIEQRKSQVEGQKRNIGTFRSKLAKLATVAKSLDRVSELARYKATTSDDKVAKITTSGEADAGSHTISITQLAKARTANTVAFADRNATSHGAGSFDIVVGSETTTVTLGAGDSTTLEGIRNAINDAEAGVRASIINDGTGHRLVLTSEETGTANAFSIQNSSYSFLTEGGGGGLTQLTGAQNANFTLDGLPISSATNTVTDALQGVSIELVGTGTNVTIGVQQDIDGIANKLKDFVDAYNDVLSYIDSQQNGSSDVTLRSIKTQLTRTFSSTLDSGLSLTALSQVGITTDSSGRAVLDREDLEEALETNFQGFLGVFRGSDDDSTHQGIADRFDALLNGDPGNPNDPSDNKVGILTSGDGALASYQKFLDTRIRGFDSQIANEERRLDKFEETLNRRFASFEGLTAQYQTQGAFISQALVGLR